MDSWVDNFSYSDDEEYIPTSQEAKDDDMLTDRILEPEVLNFPTYIFSESIRETNPIADRTRTKKQLNREEQQEIHNLISGVYDNPNNPHARGNEEYQQFLRSIHDSNRNQENNGQFEDDNDLDDDDDDLDYNQGGNIMNREEDAEDDDDDDDEDYQPDEEESDDVFYSVPTERDVELLNDKRYNSLLYDEILSNQIKEIPTQMFSIEDMKMVRKQISIFLQLLVQLLILTSQSSSTKAAFNRLYALYESLQIIINNSKVDRENTLQPCTTQDLLRFRYIYYNNIKKRVTRKEWKEQIRNVIPCSLGSKLPSIFNTFSDSFYSSLGTLVDSLCQSNNQNTVNRTSNQYPIITTNQLSLLSSLSLSNKDYKYIPNHLSRQGRDGANGRLAFTPCEDRLCCLGVLRFGKNRWGYIEYFMLPNKGALQIRNRLNNLQKTENRNGPVNTVKEVVDCYSKVRPYDYNSLHSIINQYGCQWEHIQKFFFQTMPTAVIKNMWLFDHIRNHCKVRKINEFIERYRKNEINKLKLEKQLKKEKQLNKRTAEEATTEAETTKRLKSVTLSVLEKLSLEPQESVNSEVNSTTNGSKAFHHSNEPSNSGEDIPKYLKVPFSSIPEKKEYIKNIYKYILYYVNPLVELPVIYTYLPPDLVTPTNNESSSMPFSYSSTMISPNANPNENGGPSNYPMQNSNAYYAANPNQNNVNSEFSEEEFDADYMSEGGYDNSFVNYPHNNETFNGSNGYEHDELTHM